MRRYDTILSSRYEAAVEAGSNSHTTSVINGQYEVTVAEAGAGHGEDGEDDLELTSSSHQTEDVTNDLEAELDAEAQGSPSTVSDQLRLFNNVANVADYDPNPYG